MKLFHPDPPVPPPGSRPTCQCFNLWGSKHGRTLPRFHAESQDTECAAWQRILERIDTAATTAAATFEPLSGLTGEERAQIITLPASIGRLVQVRELRLYGSHLVRLPPEIGAMAALAKLDVYTSHRLHFLPFELTRCSQLRSSRVSTRALYGNFKHRPPFPDLNRPEKAKTLSLLTPATCSVCDAPLETGKVIRRWITLAVATDWLPLLVNACSMECVHRLPTPPSGYVQEPHVGGHHIVQPPPQYF